MARGFNGLTDVIDCGTSTVVNPPTITVSCWVKFSSLVNTYTSIISRIKVGFPPDTYQLLVKSNGKLAIFTQPGGSSINYDGTGSNTLVTGTWYQIGFVYSSAFGLVGVVNGVSDNFIAGSSVFGTVSANLQFGSDIVTAGRVLNGSIQDVAIWSTALSSAENLALATGARPGTIRPGSLVGWWPLDGLASPEADLSGNVNNGTLTGTTLANGAPLSMFTPRMPQFLTPAAAPTFVPAWAVPSNRIPSGGYAT